MEGGIDLTAAGLQGCFSSFMGVDQRFDARSKLRVVAARSLQVGGAGFRGSKRERLLQDRLFIARVSIHDIGLRRE